MHTVIYYAEFQLGGSTVYAEHAGARAESEQIKSELAEKDIVFSFFRFQTGEVEISMAFRICDWNVDSPRYGFSPAKIIAGGENRIGGMSCQFSEGGLLDLEKIMSMRCFSPMHIGPKTDAGQQQNGQAVQILQMNFRIKGQGITGKNGDIQILMAAFFAEKKGGVRLLMKDGKLIGAVFQPLGKRSIIHHICGNGHAVKHTVDDGSENRLGNRSAESDGDGVEAPVVSPDFCFKILIGDQNLTGIGCGLPSGFI